MSDYTQAPACEMLATNCCACGRPLLDSASVAAGMGPDCRGKYGVASLDEETRLAANVHIYRIALKQEGPEVAERLAALRQLGLDALADRIVKRLASQYVAVIKPEGDGFAVQASYETAMSANLVRIAGRVWDKERKLNIYPARSKRAVWDALRAARPGGKCLGPKGEFVLA